jgi:uncharacterized protein involved in exopolysaccharide biosynthesis
MTKTRRLENSLGPYDDEINVREVIWAIRDGKWLIVSVTVVATAIAVAVAFLLPVIYRADALVAPRQESPADGLAGLGSQYMGLASLAGIDLGVGSNENVIIGLETLKSRKFVSDFIERHEILVPLIAANGWNSETGVLEIDEGDFDTETDTWVRKVRPPRKTIPSLQEAYEEFMDILSVSQDDETGFITIKIDHYSPNIAKEWVDWLIEDINLTLMTRDVAEAQQAIDYLNEQIASMQFADLRAVFYNLIEEKTQIVMLASVSPEYVFRSIDPAVVPEKRAKPQRVLIAIIGILAGAMIGILICLVRFDPVASDRS